MSHILGYARVSSTGQKLEVQRELLEKEGCNSVFEEKLSGKNLDRPELTLLLKTIPNYPQLSAKLSNLFGIGGVLAAI